MYLNKPFLALARQRLKAISPAMLRNRILLGVAPLIILLMMVGGYAVWLFVRLGGAVNTTLHENYTSVVAMRDLKDHALATEQAFLAYRAGAATPPQTRAILDEQAAFCRRNVESELAIITEPGERAAAQDLQARDEAFLAAIAAALAQGGESGNGWQPALEKLLDAASNILAINERAMSQKDHRARETARQSTRVMLLAIAAALPLGLYFAYRLSGIVLRPIQRLTESARELGEGNLDQVLPVSSPDELGQLADAFNKMAGKLRLYRQTTSEELVHARQATEIVFAALLDPIVIFSAEGEIVYQNPASERLRKKLAGTETTLPVVPLAMKVIQGGGDYLPESFDQSICVRVDDREKFLLPRAIGLRDGGAGAVVILHDITRFRLLDDVKTNLVATVSHELKTPLTSIRMAVYLLLEERIGALNPKQTELLIASRDDAERLLDLINNMLQSARGPPAPRGGGRPGIALGQRDGNRRAKRSEPPAGGSVGRPTRARIFQPAFQRGEALAGGRGNRAPGSRGGRRAFRAVQRDGPWSRDTERGA